MPARQRSRSDLAIKSYQIMDTPLDPLLPPNEDGISGLRVWTHFETMNDVHGNRWGQNPVSHAKIVCSCKSPDEVIWTDANDGIVYRTTLPGDVDVDPNLAASVEGLSGDQIGDFAWDAFYNATTQIKEEVSIANFLHELRDLKGMFTFLKERIDRLISGGFLGFQFGIKPLINDLKKMASVLKATRKRLRFLQKTVGKIYPVRYRREIDVAGRGDEPPEYLGLQELPLGHKYPTAVTHVQRLTSKVQLNSTVLIKNRLESLDSTLAFLDSLAAGLGLNNPAKILWNAIPLSFVFDWFVNTENVFRELNRNYGGGAPFKGSLEVVGALFSMKEEHELALWTYEPVTSESYRRRLVGSAKVTKYIRMNGLPFNDFISPTGELSSLQKMLLAALIHNRVAH